MNSTSARRIYSAGLDLTDVRRFDGVVERSGGQLIDRVFAAGERDDWPADPRWPAAAFGIKESVVKVFGGMPSGARYADISVGACLPGGGRPVGLRGPFAELAGEHGVDLVAYTAFIQGQVVLAWVLARKRHP